MVKVKFKMPTDKQIWLEVDEHLASLPEAFKKIGRLPNRQVLFDEKKAFYKATPEREEKLAISREREAVKLAATAKAKIKADAAYIELRKAQGKAVITVQIFKAKFPKIREQDIEPLSQQALHERYEAAVLMGEAISIQKKVTRVRALTRRLLYGYLAQTYGLYRKLVKSEGGGLAFNEIRAFLWNAYKVKTHHDIPQSSILLKLVFEGASEKTIHLYTRALQLADGYDVLEADFQDFIKEIGGMEKIRKAYATVKAADAGTLRPAYEQDAEYSASLNLLHSILPFKVLQLTGPEGASFKNDMLKNYFCLLIAHIDPLNQLEIFAQYPGSKALENELINRLSDVSRAKGTASWLVDKSKAITLNAEKTRDKFLDKLEKEKAKEAAHKKKGDILAKKNAAAEKRFANLRVKSNLS